MEKRLNDTMKEAPMCLMGGAMKEVNVPENISTELHNMMENLEAVKGDKFTFMVKFLMNVQALLTLIGQGTMIKDEVNEEKFKDTLSHITSILCSMHSDALGLPDSDMQEVVRAARAADSLMEHVKAQQKKK